MYRWPARFPNGTKENAGSTRGASALVSYNQLLPKLKSHNDRQMTRGAFTSRRGLDTADFETRRIGFADHSTAKGKPTGYESKRREE